jgi:metal-responsive CopG/Arc/MetJ family transcriptional regulator
MIDAELLREIDQAARRGGMSRDTFICDALREYLKRLRFQKRKKRD